MVGRRCKIIRTKATDETSHSQKFKTKTWNWGCCSCLDAFSTSKSAPKWSLGVPKSSLWAPDGTVGETLATGNSRGSILGAPGVHFGSILGSILEAFWAPFWEVKSIKFFVCFCVGFGVDLGDFWDPKWLTLGAWGATGSERARFPKPLLYQGKTMISEVWRPPGRAQIEKKRAPKPVQKTAPKFVRFFAILGAQMNPNWV